MRARPVIGSHAGAPTELVMTSLLIHGPQARAELAARLGLSTATLTRVTKPLVSQGLLRELPRIDAGIGRPRQPLAINPDVARFVGAKVTPEAVHLCVVDLGGTALQCARQRLPAHSPDDVLRALSVAVEDLGEGAPLLGVGISVGGYSRDTRTVDDSELLGWQGVPLADLAEARLGLPTVVSNDVNALAQAEHWFGAGRGHSELAVLTVGAGVGLALVAGGEVIAGQRGGFGAVGHLRVGALSDLACEHGHLGCVSSVVTNAAVRALTARPEAAETLVAAARTDPGLAAALAPASAGLARLVASIADLCDPATIVLSGETSGLALIDPEAFDAAFTAWLERPRAQAPALVVRDFEFDDWARGAAAVALRSALRRGLPAPRR